MTKTYSYGNGLVIRENMTELLEQFKQTPQRLEPVVKKHAFAISANAAANAPVKYGNLKNSLADGVEFLDPLNATVSDATDYGVFQELGTSRVPAKHFLGNAAENDAEKFFAEIRDTLDG
jgi:HK97 gp10 family phage protein